MLKNIILFTNLSLLIFPLPVFNQSIYNNIKDNFKIDKEIKIRLNNVKDDFYDIPEKSSQIYNFPWRNDEDFLDSKVKYNTPILMAGFCAVLKNPLPGEEFNVNLAAQSINRKVIRPNKVFSQNSTIGPYNENNGYKVGATYVGGKIVMDTGGGVCKIATTLYNLVVLSNLEIVERYYHSMPINYVPYGQDATVAYGIKDFKFKNTTDGNILIWSELIGNRLYMAFYGTEHPPEITWSHEINNIIKPSIKYVKNENLNNGEMKTIIQGLDGATVKSKIQIKYNDGTIKIKDMGISQYEPLPELIEIN